VNNAPFLDQGYDKAHHRHQERNPSPGGHEQNRWGCVHPACWNLQLLGRDPKGQNRLALELSVRSHRSYQEQNGIQS